MILTSDLGCSSPVGCQDLMQWFLSSFQSPYVYIYFLSIYFCVYMYHTCIKHLHVSNHLFFLEVNHPSGCLPQKNHPFDENAWSTWTISSTWSWPCFSRDVGCRITSNPSGFNPVVIIPFLNQRLPPDHVDHVSPPKRNKRGFYKAMSI